MKIQSFDGARLVTEKGTFTLYEENVWLNDAELSQEALREMVAKRGKTRKARKGHT